jgi:2-polyprenyl-6-methoxyphenol hydroxylase-like FAD-dependent oxidoreductase
MAQAAEPKNVKLDALIVGAGPVGLMMAWTLAAQGVRCRIIDAAAAPETESRAIGIQSRTLEVFQMAGFVDEFVKIGHPLTAFNLHGRDGSQMFHVDFTDLPSRYKFLMTLPQQETERILTEQLRAQGVGIERPAKLVAFEQRDEEVLAHILNAEGAETEIACDWLIGCDGTHSRVRELLGLQFAGKTYDLQFMLGDVKIDTELSEDQGHGFSRAEGLLAVFPLGNQRWRLIADNPAPGFEQRDKPSLEEWQTIVDTRASVPMELSDPNWTAYFRVHARIVESLRRGRVFVLGDSAHIHSPALAQGMNTGIQDAWNLGWKLALVQKGLAKRALIDSYESERLPVEQAVLKITDFTQTVVANTDSKVQVVRDMIVPLAFHFPFVEDKARERISELNVSYADSPIVENSLLPSGPKAGDRAPDAAITVGGETKNLYSLFGREHVLLVLPHPKSANVDAKRPAFGGDLQQNLLRLRDLYGEMLKIYSVVRDGEFEAGSEGGSIVDVNGEIANSYGAITALYLVRPDGYIAYRSGASQVGKLEEYLEKWYVPREQSNMQELRAG